MTFNVLNRPPKSLIWCMAVVWAICVGGLIVTIINGGAVGPWVALVVLGCICTVVTAWVVSRSTRWNDDRTKQILLSQAKTAREREEIIKSLRSGRGRR